MKKTKKVMGIILLVLYVVIGALVLTWNYTSGADGMSMLALEILAIIGIVMGILSILDKNESQDE